MGTASTESNGLIEESKVKVKNHGRCRRPATLSYNFKKIECIIFGMHAYTSKLPLLASITSPKKPRIQTHQDVSNPEILL